jgi:hypothetical protein
MTGKTGQG